MTPESAPRREAYRGSASFQDTRADRLLFFGRNQEKEKLLNLVLSEPLTVLFARSGIGKTSLINAGLLQQLRDLRFFPIVARVAHAPDGDPVRSVIDDLKKSALSAGIEMVGTPRKESLWELFHAMRFHHHGGVLRPLLILDQFEELFTTIRRREAFVRDLANLVRHRVPEDVAAAETRRLESLSINDSERQAIISLLYGEGGPDVKVLLSLREDHLAELENLRSSMPTILRATLRLEPLSVDQARDAIEKPGARFEVLGDDTFTFEPGVVDAMLVFLSQRVAGGSIAGSSVSSVDPAQLQILCSHLDQIRRRKEAKQITIADLGGERGMEKIMVSHYQRLLGRFPSLRLNWSARHARPSVHNLLLFSRPRAAIRRLCESGLITRGGQRNSLMGDVIHDKYGVGESDLQQLVEARLLRTDTRLDQPFFELSHDTLIAPIRSYARKELRVQSIVAAVIYLLLLVPVVMTQWERREAAREAAVHQAAAARRKQAVESAAPADRSRKVESMLENGQSDFAGYNLTQVDLSQVAPTPADTQKRDFSGADLRGANLKNFKQLASSFIKTHLEGVDLSGAFIPNSNFTGAYLQRADLSNANLSLAELAGADATEANFTAADLSSADFSHAKLGGAIFRGANLRRANFGGVTIDGRTNFTKTAWWVAAGWSASLFQRLPKESSPATFSASDVYKARRTALDSSVQLAQNARKRTNALNERAWFTAIAGTDLEGALHDADEALKLAPQSFDALDTRGYLELRLGRYDEARNDLDKAVQLRKLIPNRTLGELQYHLALVCEYQPDAACAKAALAEAGRLRYQPTYELLLTPHRESQSATAPASPAAAPPEELR